MNKFISLFLALSCGVFGSLRGAELTYENYTVPLQHIENLEPIKLTVKHREALKRLKLVLLIDRSGSMLSTDEYSFSNLNAAPPSKFHNPSRPGPYWKRMDSAFLIASYLGDTMFSFDTNGCIPVYFFGSEVEKIEIRNNRDLYAGLSHHTPDSSQTTNLSDALKLAFNDNIHDDNYVLFVVITDGQPDCKKSKIKKILKRNLAKDDPHGNRLNCFFIQIGDDNKADKFLKYLDKSKSIKKNVETKKDDWVYQHPPLKVILQAIFEDQT